MSFSTTILIVIGATLLYYAGMITYDLYVADKLKSESDENREELIDVRDQLQDFKSYDVNTPDEETRKKRSFETFFCKGLSAEKMSHLMEDAAMGTPNAELKNLLIRCEKIASEQI